MDELVDVTSAEELRELLGEPTLRVRTKERDVLTDMDKRWLAASPFCILATSDDAGNCDVSPKGDPAGLALVLDDHTIALPERPGNRRADGFGNILRNPRVGLAFVIPGRGETLRINGPARLVKEAPFFDDMIVKGHRPRFAVVVKTQQVFFHCAKAFMRSRLWNPETWEPDALPPQAEIVKAVQRTEETLEELTAHYGERYAEKLYK